MTISSKRAEYVALTSLLLSVLFFVITLLIGRWSGYFAIYAVSWFILSGGLICLVLVFQFHQRALAEQEKLDMGQLAKGERISAIFQAEGEHAELFAIAQRRLELFERWFLPIFSALIGLYQLGIGLYLLKAVSVNADIGAKRPDICAVCMMAIAFVCFLISRYATGMSAQLQWRPLRAGGSFLLGTAVLCFALAISFAFVYFQYFVALSVVGWVIPILLVVLGVETALNVVLDIYRPRLKGQYSKSAFDSRLLGIISEPGGIFRSAAGAIDYQFGFEVSQTWFYKLLEKAIVPLILFAAITIYLSSCIVVVEPNEEAIIEHFGNPFIDANNVRLAGPGLTFKWPWPIDIAYKYPTKKIMEVSIGFVPDTSGEAAKGIYGPLLWGKTHYKEEYKLLVASEEKSGSSGAGAAPVSLIIAAIPMQYRIKDLYSFIYNNKDSERLLEAICYRELTRFAAGAKIEVDTEADLRESLLGAGRAEAKEILTSEIQKAADAEGLGVEIVFLGLAGIHPPPEVAAAYQKVIGAVQEKQSLILGAEAKRNKTLSTLVGSVADTNSLYNLAAEYKRAIEENKSDRIEKLGGALDLAFAQAGGNIFATLRGAKSYAFEAATLARASGERFDSQLKAYRAAKEIYSRDQRLIALEEALDNIRKYIVVVDPNDTQVFIVDVKEKLVPSLYEVGGFVESSEK